MCDAVMTGGSEAAITPTGVAGFANMTALSNSGISRPYDTERDGFVIAEGAGVLVLEEWEQAVEAAPMISPQMWAPRATACSHSSSTSTPAPSAITKPSRSVS